MSKRQDFITQQMSEGSTTERHAERDEISKLAKQLASQMPNDTTDRITYIRNLVEKVKAKQLDVEVFKNLIKMTNSWAELSAATKKENRPLKRGTKS
jgi:hypothetical protein